MIVLFPCHPLDQKQADEPFQSEHQVLKSSNVRCSLFDFDALALEEFKPKPELNSEDLVLYRGWMLNPNSYNSLVKMVQETGAKMITSTEEFVLSHHLPHWYQSCKDLTPESVFLSVEADIVLESEKLNWQKYFVKDYVKSNYDERGSIANSPSEVAEIVNLIKEHRGDIEGVIALRKVEQFRQETETRYFILGNKIYSPNASIPPIVEEISKRDRAQFYSVDIIENFEGVHRLIEIGDGQVSDKKTWNTEDFCNLIAENA